MEASLFGPYHLFYQILVLAFVALGVFCGWKIYEKMGIEGWKCIIPFYDVFVLFDPLRKPKLWLLWMNLWLIPVGIFYYLMIFYNYLQIPLGVISGLALLAFLYFSIRLIRTLCKSFGKGIPFTIGMLFFPLIFMAILGFGNSTFTPPLPKRRFDRLPDPENEEPSNSFSDSMEEHGAQTDLIEAR